IVRVEIGFLKQGFLRALQKAKFAVFQYFLVALEIFLVQRFVLTACDYAKKRVKILIQHSSRCQAPLHLHSSQECLTFPSLIGSFCALPCRWPPRPRSTTSCTFPTRPFPRQICGAADAGASLSTPSLPRRLR